MRPWQFSRPKGPGYGISRNFYLSVLCSHATLPSILQVINPKGEGGAAEGFGAPLAEGADKSSLQQPMGRGTYAVAMKDRKTVLRMIVLSRDEAGYDPDAFALSSLAATADPELLARMRGTWNLAQFTFETHDPEVFPALDFLLGITVRLALLAEGVIADPICRRYLLPHQVFVRDRMDPRIDSRDHIAIQSLSRNDGLQVFTLGMQKFALPEYEMHGVPPEALPLATQFLLALSQRVLLGDLTRDGEQFGAPKFAFEARTGGLDPGLWRGIPVFELLPPSRKTVLECLQAWQVATSNKS